MSKNWTRLCLRWSQIVFGENYKMLSPRVRAMRLLEEALELAQAENVLASEAETIQGKGSPAARKISAALKGRASPTLGMTFGPETSAKHRAAQLGKKRGPYKERCAL